MESNSPDLGYEYSAKISRRPIKWPNGERVAVIITLNMEYWNPVLIDGNIPYPAGPNIIPLPIPRGMPDFVNYTWREYGQRVGVWRVINTLDKYGLRASATLSSELGKKCPEIISETKKRGWEFIAHSDIESNIPINFADDIEAERSMIRRTVKGLEETTGTRPLGWLSPSISPTVNTPGILVDEGFKFFCDFINDDQPYAIKSRGRTLISIPYSSEMNDYLLFMRQSLGADGVFDAVKEYFDVLYEEGGKSGMIMNLGLHPHVIGQPHRIRTLDRILEYIVSKAPNVWFPRRIEIANWYEKTYL
ncbi:MAG: polysaccharide deacetylase family protein [Nitrososphaerota archaeon]|nr:polysaccharide deacetylase family protein [Nitrososphaerota archaeon]MDG6923231.1 polysaccharide deacetylase family protein [Nitrososphaerota archaeon]